MFVWNVIRSKVIIRVRELSGFSRAKLDRDARQRMQRATCNMCVVCGWCSSDVQHVCDGWRVCRARCGVGGSLAKTDHAAGAFLCVCAHKPPDVHVPRLCATRRARVCVSDRCPPVLVESFSMHVSVGPPVVR
jgi:hypothetical protein